MSTQNGKKSIKLFVRAYIKFFIFRGEFLYHVKTASKDK